MTQQEGAGGIYRAEALAYWQSRRQAEPPDLPAAPRAALIVGATLASFLLALFALFALPLPRRVDWRASLAWDGGPGAPRVQAAVPAPQVVLLKRALRLRFVADDGLVLELDLVELRDEAQAVRALVPDAPEGTLLAALRAPATAPAHPGPRPGRVEALLPGSPLLSRGF